MSLVWLLWAYCTKQWCPKRIKDERAVIDRMLKEDDDMGIHNTCPVKIQSYCPHSDGQARTFKRLGLAFRVDPDLGAILA